MAPPLKPLGMPGVPAGVATGAVARPAVAGNFDAEYAAVFAPRTHTFETVNFRTPASAANRAAGVVPLRRGDVQRVGLLATGLAMVLGVAAALLAFAVDQGVRGGYAVVYRVTGAVLGGGTGAAAGGASAARTAAGAAVFAALNAAAVAAAASLVVFVAPPGSGSGIPELKSYLNGVRVPGFLRARTLVVKATGVVAAIAGGLVIGKQGPMIHAVAILAAGLSQGASGSLGARLRGARAARMLAPLRTEGWKRDFTTIGAATGVAVAFGAPLGAWVWVYEDAATHWSWTVGLLALTASLVGGALVGLLNRLARGVTGGLVSTSLVGVGKLTVAGGSALIGGAGGYPLIDFPLFAVLGVVGGLYGAALPAINRRLTLFRYRHISRPVARLVEAVGVALLTATVRYGVTAWGGSCVPVGGVGGGLDVGAAVGSNELDFSRWACGPGQVNDWASLMYSPGDVVARTLLYAPGEKTLGAAPLAAAAVFFGVFAVFTYGLAIPSGIFFPGVIIGAATGRLLGIGVAAVWTARPADAPVAVEAYALVGVVAVLAGITRTVSVAIIVLEATGAFTASYAAAVAALIAKAVSDAFVADGIYDTHIKLKGMPWLPATPHEPHYYEQVLVNDLMVRRVIGVRRRVPIGDLVALLRRSSHHAFPVFLKLALPPTGGAADGAPAAMVPSLAAAGFREASMTPSAQPAPPSPSTFKVLSGGIGYPRDRRLSSSGGAGKARHVRSPSAPMLASLGRSTPTRTTPSPSPSQALPVGAVPLTTPSGAALPPLPPMRLPRRVRQSVTSEELSDVAAAATTTGAGAATTESDTEGVPRDTPTGRRRPPRVRRRGRPPRRPRADSADSASSSSADEGARSWSDEDGDARQRAAGSAVATSAAAGRLPPVPAASPSPAARPPPSLRTSVDDQADALYPMRRPPGAAPTAAVVNFPLSVTMSVVQDDVAGPFGRAWDFVLFTRNRTEDGKERAGRDKQSTYHLEGMVERPTLVGLVRAAAVSARAATEGHSFSTASSSAGGGGATAAADAAYRGVVPPGAPGAGVCGWGASSDALPDASADALPTEAFDAAWPPPASLPDEAALMASLPAASLDTPIDLGPYVDVNPLLLSHTATAREAYTLLRGTGARHVLAMDLSGGHVAGVLTRKDILYEAVEEALGREAGAAGAPAADAKRVDGDADGAAAV